MKDASYIENSIVPFYNYSIVLFQFVFFLFLLSAKTQKSENSSYILSYYSTYTLLTIKEAKI